MKICMIASSGGHLEEINQLNEVKKKYEVYYVVTDTPHTRNDAKYKYLIKDFDRRNIIYFIINFIKMCFSQFKIFIKEKPDIIITTGAGLVIPTCIVAKICRKKIIYIESFARITSPSKTGKLLYYITDLFIIQHKELFKFYPKAFYGGWIF